MIYQILIVLYLLVAIALVGLVLIQQGKGADMGASFGAGASNTLFGSSGSGNFLTRTTAILAVLFFLLSLGIGNLTNSKHGSKNDIDYLKEDVQKTEQASQPEQPQDTNAIPAAPGNDGTNDSEQGN